MGQNYFQMGVQGSGFTLCVHWPHPRRFYALRLRHPWVLSCYYSGGTVLGDVFHKCCSAAWCGACVHRYNQKRLKKTPKPTTEKTTEKTTNTLWLDMGQEGSQGKCSVVSQDLLACPFFFFCWGGLFWIFLSAVACLKRGKRVNKCDPLA